MDILWGSGGLSGRFKEVQKSLISGLFKIELAFSSTWNIFFQEYEQLKNQMLSQTFFKVTKITTK